jgi:hypothetical protein
MNDSSPKQKKKNLVREPSGLLPDTSEKGKTTLFLNS